jgi:hypothetical protein
MYVIMVCHRHFYLYCTQWSCTSSSLRLTTTLCVYVCVRWADAVYRHSHSCFKHLCLWWSGGLRVKCYTHIHRSWDWFPFMYIMCRYFYSQLSTFTSARDKQFQNVKCTSPSPCSGPTYSCSSVFALVGLRKCALSVFHIWSENTDHVWRHQERAKFPAFFGDSLNEKLPYNVVGLYKMLPSQVLLEFKI